MGISAEALSVLVVLLLHFALFSWALRNIIKSPLSSFEKTSWILLCLILAFLGVGIYYTYFRQYFLKLELFHITLAVLLIGFLFSFQMWGVGEFSISTGINNWLRMIGLAVVALGVHLGVQKALARKYDSMAHFRIWIFGSIIAILLAFITNGWFCWVAVGVMVVVSEPLYRIGKRGDNKMISPFEKSKIVVAGTFASLGLAVLAKLIGPYINEVLFKQFMYMNLWIAVFSIVPFMLVHFWGAAKAERHLHGKNYATLGVNNEWKNQWVRLRGTMKFIGTYLSEGEIIFFGSRLLWMFTAVFAIVSAGLLLFLNPILSILIATILAVILFAWWHYYWEPGTAPGKAGDPKTFEWPPK